ncbi:MAG: 2-amino-4-hydroxy-6-hydroxymethyldihydropteridine diphosphokinase [Prevotellaceae bacterium]|nr:2-amino-4-hydroxy-6-hydroxymethyldihydropteridine diphosphokinase [Prevotellaceae bacterium]
MNVFLLLGSNMGNREAMLREACALLAAQAGTVTGQSGYYESEPWGFEAATWFVNQAVQVETALGPAQLLHAIQRIERQLGRVRPTSPGAYASRPIDIDILFYGHDVIHTQELVVPHPLLPRRRFALLPLCELAPGFVHPLLRATVASLLLRCNDRGAVRPFGERETENSVLRTV